MVQGQYNLYYADTRPVVRGAAPYNYGGVYVRWANMQWYR